MVFFPASMLETLKKKKKRAVMEADSMKEELKEEKNTLMKRAIKKVGYF